MMATTSTSTTSPAAPMVVMIASTGHFDFIGLGATEEEATQALLSRWKALCMDNPNADKRYMKKLIDEGSVQSVTVQPGHAVLYGID